MNIPIFNCTEEAIDYGKIMSADMVKVFLSENQKHNEESKRLRQAGKWNEAMQIAVKASSTERPSNRFRVRRFGGINNGLCNHLVQWRRRSH